MTRRPPRSTLFPYTPLFRSSRSRRIGTAEPYSGRALSSNSSRIRPGSEPGLMRELFEDKARPDRKSTRLNSSHDQISYAVFCLKKKKKQNTRTLSHNEHVHQ